IAIDLNTSATPHRLVNFLPTCSVQDVLHSRTLFLLDFTAIPAAGTSAVGTGPPSRRPRTTAGGNLSARDGRGCGICGYALGPLRLISGQPCALLFFESLRDVFGT